MSSLSPSDLAKFHSHLTSGDAEAPLTQPEGKSPNDLGFEAAPRRIPNFGHALLFVSFAGLMLILSEIALYALGKPPAAVQAGVVTLQHPKWQIGAMAATYLATLLTAWGFYPVVWQRAFLDGLSWHWQTARRQAVRLVILGLVLGIVVQFITNFFTTPKSMPIDGFFQTQSDVWLLTLFGTIVAPIFEEICFRGFLLPAFAIAYDWLRLPRTPEARARWQTTTMLSPAGLLFSAVLSSILFACLHAEQVAYAWPAVIAIFSVSLVLTFVRVKTQSVASSAMVHSAYNFSVFLMVMIATGGYRHLDRMTK
jgi:uncharacterized protein